MSKKGKAVCRKLFLAELGLTPLKPPKLHYFLLIPHCPSWPVLPCRTFVPKLEPVLSAKHEEAKHLLGRARMKAKTQPLRASHDIVPIIAQGSR